MTRVLPAGTIQAIVIKYLRCLPMKERHWVAIIVRRAYA